MLGLMQRTYQGLVFSNTDQHSKLESEGIADGRLGAVGESLDGALAEAVVALHVLAQLSHLGLQVSELAQLLHERCLRVEQDVKEDVLLTVPVLVNKALHIVKDNACVVTNT